MNTIKNLTIDQANCLLDRAKKIDRARSIGFTEQRVIEEVSYARLVESCEGTLICPVADKMDGDNNPNQTKEVRK